jgi:hypothetical protein
MKDWGDSDSRRGLTLIVEAWVLGALLLVCLGALIAGVVG